MSLPHRRRPPITEAQIFEARSTAAVSGIYSSKMRADGWVFNRFSFMELAKALRDRRITWERFVKLYTEIMDNPNARPLERMAAADKLRECMGFVAVNTEACRRVMGIEMPAMGPDLPERGRTVKTKAGSKFAEHFNDGLTGQAVG